ncbi:MAG: deoxyribodipyrimidine photo-lyase [Planctomycetaceae bacterium]|nr:deoxyribodipyrimidine photo-lyase [Planctomycetaceae bacterium]
MTAKRASIVWFRQDLRLADNPALTAAVEREAPVACVYIWAPDEEGDWPPGSASRWWLHHSLASLDAQLRERGSRLIIRRGPTLTALQAIIAETGAEAVFWNRRYEPAVVRRDAQVLRSLKQSGVQVSHSNSALLFEPHDVETGQGKPYQVFTPFWKACLAKPAPDEPLPAPDKILGVTPGLESLALDQLQLLPTIPWDRGFYHAWDPGEPAALQELSRFVSERMHDYPEARDVPAEPGTSRMSPRLHFGEIGPRQVWAAASAKPQASGGAYLREIGWREFAHHVLHHFPQTTRAPLRDKFEKFPWQTDAAALKAWQRGRTGYPIVDAGMRELWETGWMHNRVRMIVGSFLTKDLLVSWTAGARWFWDTLVDADLANNTLGWQWIAGCGADAAPYFRVFNPVSQGEKFDGDGAYARRWVPEISGLPDGAIHAPWTADRSELQRAGVTLGETYPEPMVDHAAARKRALEAYGR